MEHQYEERNSDQEKELLNRIAQIEDDSKMIKRMTKKDYIVVGVIITICLVAVIAGAFLHQITQDSLKGISKDHITYLSVRYYAEQTEDYRTIDVFLKEQQIWIDDEEYELDDAQSEELRELIYNYSYAVQEQEEEYWPQTEEYPEMMLLFDYEVQFGDEEYSMDGALCYPDGWEEFIDKIVAVRGRIQCHKDTVCHRIFV